MLHDEAALAVPEDLGSDDSGADVADPRGRRPAPARPGGAARKRQRQCLPKHFWIVSVDNFHGKSHMKEFTLKGVMQVAEVKRFAALTSEDCIDENKAFIQEQARARGIDLNTDVLCWRADGARREEQPLKLPRAAAKRWHSVVSLNASCAEVIEAHRRWNTMVGKQQAWLMDPAECEALLAGGIAWLTTPVHHSTLCGIAAPEKPQQAQAQEADAVLSASGNAVIQLRVRRGFATHKFSSQCITTALQLHWMLRNTRDTSLDDVVKLAWRVSLPAAEWQQLERRLESGELQVPKKSMLNFATVKLDVLYSVFQRSLLDVSRGFRYIAADSSPIQYVNYFCVREERVLFPASMTDAEILCSSLQEHFASRHLPLSTLGFGAAGVLHKGVNLCHSIILESGSDKGFEKYRREVRGYCSDQGTEAAIADSGCALAGGACDLHQWAAAVEAARNGSLSSAPGSFLLPLAVFVPDHLHMLFGALEDAVKQTDAWAFMENQLRTLNKLLRSSAYKTRFIETCVVDRREKALLRRSMDELTDWKWEYLSRFLLGLRPVLPIVIARFDPEKFSKGMVGDGTMGKVDPNLVSDLAGVVSDPLLAQRCEVLRCIAFACDRQATKLEGCRCHEAVLADATRSWNDRVRAYRAASSACVWKGKRAMELALGLPNEIMRAIESASDEHLREAYAAASGETRQTMRALEASLKACLQQQLKGKFAFWSHLPYSLIGVVGCCRCFGLIGADVARARALSCLREFDDALAQGMAQKMHRVSVHFLAEGSALRAQLFAFGNGDADLEAYPQLTLELLAYAMVPCVSRRVEAVHSGIKSWKNKATIHTMPWIGSKIRRQDVTACLKRFDFVSWLQVNWNKRDVLRRSLLCVFKWHQVSAMSISKVLQWWYQSGPDTQFRDLSAVAASLKEWSGAAKANLKPEVAPIADGEALLLKYFKEMFCHVGVLWSAPKQALMNGLPSDVQHFAIDAGAAPSDTPELWQKKSTVLDVGSRVCAIVQAMSAGVGAGGAVHMPLLRAEEVAGMMFWKVVSAYPEHKKNVKPSHLTASRAEVNVVLYAQPTMCSPTEVSLHVERGQHVALDLSKLDLVALLSKLTRWSVDEGTASRLALPRGAVSELVALDAMLVGNKVPAPVNRGGGVFQAPEGAATAMAMSIVARLDRERAYANTRRFVSASTLEHWSGDVVGVLQKHRVLQATLGEFGDSELALLPEGISFEQTLQVSDQMRVMALPARAEAQGSKLEMLVQLVREGWTARDVVVEPLLPDGPRELSLNMLLRSKRYWDALVESEAILARGSPAIYHNKPEAYYECLFRYDDLQALHAHPGFAEFGNKQFQQLLRGEVPTVMPALADGHALMHADDDQPEPGPAAAPLAIADVAGPDVVAELDVVAAGADPIPIAPVAMAVPLAMAIGVPDAAGDLRPVALLGFVVRFDRWSHSSGVLRCYVSCTNPTHRACFRYMQEDQRPTRKEVVATLFGWAELGDGLDRAGHQSKECFASEARVAEILALLP